ncbi:MAG: hypothetical protein ACYCXG_12145 [Acidiferrobacter sp.]
MLISKGDNFIRYLDFSAADIGDDFWSVKHAQYLHQVISIKHFVVTEITQKLTICVSDDGESLRLKKNSEQDSCYLQDDPFFQQLTIDFNRQSHINTIRTFVKNASNRDFDQELLDAFDAWAKRLRDHRRP